MCPAGAIPATAFNTGGVPDRLDVIHALLPNPAALGGDRPRSARRAFLVTTAIVARGAERHGACVTPRSGCHERLMFWVAGLTSEAARRIDCRVRCADRRPHNHLERCGLSRGSIVTLDDSEQIQQDGLTIDV